MRIQLLWQRQSCFIAFDPGLHLQVLARCTWITIPPLNSFLNFDRQQRSWPHYAKEWQKSEKYCRAAGLHTRRHENGKNRSEVMTSKFLSRNGEIYRVLIENEDTCWVISYEKIELQNRFNVSLDTWCSSSSRIIPWSMAVSLLHIRKNSSCSGILNRASQSRTVLTRLQEPQLVSANIYLIFSGLES